MLSSSKEEQKLPLFNFLFVSIKNQEVGEIRQNPEPFNINLTNTNNAIYVVVGRIKSEKYLQNKLSRFLSLFCLYVC